MQNDFRDQEDILVKQYEEMLRNQSSYFFDVEAYEVIIEYYVQLGEWEKAFKACNLGIEQYPYSVELLTEKGRILLDMGRSQEAIETLERIDSFQPKDFDSSLIKSNAYCLVGRFDDAIQLLEEMLLWQQNAHDEVLFNLALAYQSCGKLEKAIDFHKEAIKANIYHDSAIVELTFCLEYLDKLEEGVAFFETIINQEPYNAEAWYNLGQIHLRMNAYADALQALDYAIIIQSDFDAAFFAQGCAFMNLEKYEEAQKSFEKSLSLCSEPYPDLLCHLAASLEKQGQFDAAFQHYQKAIKLDNLWDEAWFGAGACLDVSDRWLEAQHFIKRAKELNPNNPTYWLVYANLEYKMGHIVSSLEAFEQAAELAPYNIDVWLNWSFIYYEQGNYQEAIDILEDILEDLPEEVELLYRLVAYEIEAGYYKEAFHHLENALLIDYDKHIVLYDFFTELETQKALFKIIEQYRPED